MSELLANLGTRADVTVRVTTGTEYFRKGEVELSIRGDGRVDIVNRASGAVRTYSGTLDAQEVAALGEQFAAAGFMTLRPGEGDRSPGDSLVILELLQGDKKLLRTEMWHADRYDMPGLDAIVTSNDEIVQKLTDGFLPY